MIDEADFLEPDYWLGKLLAVLHGDDGQCLITQGVVHATETAIAGYYGLIEAQSEAKATLLVYRLALERIAGKWADPVDLARKALDVGEKP